MIKSKIYIFLILGVFQLFVGNAQILYLKTGSNIYLSSNAVLTISGGVKINSGASIVHKTGSAQSSVYLSGTWNNLGTYTHNNNGKLIFSGDISDTITGLASQTFYNFWINKSDTTKFVNIAAGTDISITKDLRLVSNNLLNIGNSNLTIDTSAVIYPDSTSIYTYLPNDPLNDPFSSVKHITCDGKVQDTTANNGKSRIIRKLPTLGPIPQDRFVRFPIGTPLDTSNPVLRMYSPARYIFYANQDTFNTGCYITMNCVSKEYPDVQSPGVALRKYWVVRSNIGAMVAGYDVRFDYNLAEVQGNEALYYFALFFRNNTYFINPGANGYGVEPVNHRFRVDGVNQEASAGRVYLSGQWTAGEASAAFLRYYTRQNGNFNDPNTWSHVGYGGAAASNYPIAVNAQAYIGNSDTVTLNYATPNLLLVTVDPTGYLKITGGETSYVLSDTFHLKDGGMLGISSPNGITVKGNNTGNIHGNFTRDYSNNASYVYLGTANQVTGNALPNAVSSLTINNSGVVTDTVSLSGTVSIRDSLVINQGVFSLFRNGTYTANGYSTDTSTRVLIMRGGELICQNFPSNYKSPTFTAGAINFGGTGSLTIPSSISTINGLPNVCQYNDLKLSGIRGTNTFITLNPDGEIRVGGNFDISGLSFNAVPNTDRFIVTGSNVVFNKSSGTQSIPSSYPVSTPLTYRLTYYNLSINGGGTKQFVYGDDRVYIRNNIYLINGTLSSNGFDTWILGDWVASAGGIFSPGTRKVTFEANGSSDTIISNGISFNKVDIKGTSSGSVIFKDNFSVNDSLTITTANLISDVHDTLKLNGHFTNNGIFTASTGTVLFQNTASNQTIMNNGTGTFYNITVNKARGLNVDVNGTTLLTITDSLNLIAGNIGGRVAGKSIYLQNSGGIYRPGSTPGHVDGILRLQVPLSSSTLNFSIGQGTAYVPLKITINSTGGTIGFLEAFTDLDLNATGVTRAIIDGLDPGGASLDTTKNVRRYWSLNTNITGNTFNLGTRNYDLQIKYLRSDIRNSADSLKFECRQRDGNANPNSWYRTNTAIRSDSTMSIESNSRLPQNTIEYFYVGEPKYFNFWSIASGNWSVAANWSTADYLGQSATRAPQSYDNIYIGNGNAITLDNNFSINTGRTITIDSAGPSGLTGQLICGNYNISGAGTFTINSGGTLSIGDTAGIRAAGTALGNIRTTVRNYNGTTAHNNGNFIYANNQVGAVTTFSAGDGLPATMKTLTVNLGTSSLRLKFYKPSPYAYQIKDSFNINQGIADLSYIITKLGGNFVIGANGSFVPAAGTVANNSYRLQYGTSTEVNDSTTVQGGFIFNGYGTNQIIRTSQDSLIFNRISLNKISGKVISTTNIRVVQLWLWGANRASFDFNTYNKWLLIHDNIGDQSSTGYWVCRGSPMTDTRTDLVDPTYGYIDGRLIRYMETGDDRVFPIGTDLHYSPVNLIANTATTGGMVEVIAADGNHPKFNINGQQIKPSSNIQRYWEISIPSISGYPGFVLGANAIRARLIYYPDDLRGGANPTSNYFIFRKRAWNTNSALSNKWVCLNDTITPYQRISNGTPITSYESWTDVNTPNSKTLNGIFVDTSQFSSARCISLMIGDTAAPLIRYFYSKMGITGNWTDTSKWASNFYGGPGARAYPSQNSNANNDIVFIGDTLGASSKINIDAASVTATSVTLEKNGTGTARGILVCPGENVLNSYQFVQRNGGQLEIGSANGISVLGTNTGNIRATVTRNFNLYQSNNNYFAFIGTGNQITGTGFPVGLLNGTSIPQGIGMLEIRNTGASGTRTVTLSDSILIKDSLKITSGILNYPSSHHIQLLGDFINDTLQGSSSLNISTGSSNFLFLDTISVQKLRGKADQTIFPGAVIINKPNGKLVDTSYHVKFLGNLTFNSPTVFELGDNYILTLGASSYFVTNGTWGVNCGLKVSGGPNTAKVTKIFTAGSPRTLDSLFVPVSEDSLGLRTPNIPRYSAANIHLNIMNFSTGAPFATLTLRSVFPHPNAPAGTPKMLAKYWSISDSGISRSGATSTSDINLIYTPSEVIGNQVNYIPCYYKRTGVSGWSFNLNNPASAVFDTINKVINIQASQRTPDVDWTAGDPSTFALGRSFWSRVTTGNWGDLSSWSNDKTNRHSATDTALNIPGYYPGDTVYIHNTNTITLNVAPQNIIDSMIIASTTGFAGTGTLQFSTSAGSNKLLTVRNGVLLGTSGLVNKAAGAVSSIDTLRIYKDLTNNGTTAGCGMNFANSATNNFVLDFVDTTNSKINGTGNFTNIGTFSISKSTNQDTLINNSTSLSTGFTSSTYKKFIMNTGVYRHNNTGSALLSLNAGGDLIIGNNTGIDIPMGSISTGDGFIMQQNASLNLRGGSMTVGGVANENFQYESGTTVNIGSTGTTTSTLTVAGNFRRRYLSSVTNFYINNYGYLEVMKFGATTDSNNRRGGFDLGQSVSNFNMSGGTITITRPMTLSGNYKDPDYLNLVSNDTITGGTIQIGDTTVSFTAPANTNFSILSEPPIWNLELHNTYSLDLLFAGANTIISNYFRIRRMASASLNGQSILIGGDFINDSILHLGSSGSRRITFNGNPNAIPATSQNQNIKIKKAYGTGLNDFLFDLVINKPGGGSVNLVSDAVYVNSNIILTNSLQFTSTNTSIINTNTNYFQLGTSTSDAATVQRNGLGHVNGEFRQWFNNGNYTYFIPIGASTVAAFTPATIVTSTASATAGLVSFTAYGIKHPDLANLSNIDTSTSIDRYWNINPKAVSPYPAFALGTNGYYNLTLQFVKGAIPTGDIKSSAILGAFEQFRRTPSWNTAGTWYSTTPDIRTDSSTKGINFTTWGDFVVGDPAGFKFYSIANGEWSTPSTWSLTGYSGVASTIYAPSGIGDRVYIGNGKTVTLSNSTPNIRSVVIETYNLNPGTLLFQNDKYLRSETFILNDSCTLGTTDAYGFNSLTSLNNFAGGVRSTITRTYGQGRFIYNGTTSQATGDGLVTAKSIIVNTSGSNNSVGLGSNHVIIYDSLAVNTSKFGFNNDTFELKGQLVVKTPAKITGTDGALIVSSNNNQYFVLNNTGGDTINNLQLSKPAGKVIISGSDTTGNLYIRDTLLFNTGNVGIIDSRTNTRRVILISNSTKILRSGLGHIDGILDRPFSTSSESFKYEVGKGFTYLPITLSLSAGTGNAGIVRGWVDTLNFLVSRLDNVKRINYFWNLTNASTFTLGTRLANTTIQFPSSLLSNLYGGAVNNNTVLKRLSIPAETKLWSLRTTYPSQLTWNSGIASVSITNSTDYWTGLGQFYVGDKGSVNFYSRQSGNWNDYNCWTLDPSHIGSSTGGDYPNQDADCLQDVIYIGLNHTITLNVPNVYIDTLVVRHGSIFDIGTGIINCGLCGSPTPTLGLISLRDTATIRLGGANIPRTDTNFINFKIYDINSNTYIDFYGNQVIPNNPFSNTLYLNNVIFSQSGTKLIGNTPVIINGNCYIKNGATLFLTGGIKYLTVKKNIYNNSILNNSGFIQIGQ